MAPSFPSLIVFLSSLCRTGACLPALSSRLGWEGPKFDDSEKVWYSSFFIVPCWTREMESIGRGPTFGDFVTISNRRVYVMVARQQSIKVYPLPPLLNVMYCVRVSLWTVKIFLPQHLKRRRSWVISVYLWVEQWSRACSRSSANGSADWTAAVWGWGTGYPGHPSASHTCRGTKKIFWFLKQGIFQMKSIGLWIHKARWGPISLPAC